MTKATFDWLYNGHGRGPRIFRACLLIFEIAILAFFVATSFVPLQPWVIAADAAIAALLAVDCSLRLWIHSPRH